MKYKWHGCHGCARSSGCIQTLYVDIDVDASMLLAQWPAFLQVSKVARNMVALVATSIFRFPTANIIISCRLHSNMRPGFESDIVPITLRPGSFRRTTGSRQLGGHRTRVVGAGDINSASGHLRSFRLCLRSCFRSLFSSFEATPPSFPNLHLSTSTLSLSQFLSKLTKSKHLQQNGDRNP
jgi:hypothetical protein